MVTRAGQAFDAWRTADQAARDAEHVLQDAWNRYALGEASPPAKELIQRVTHLRALAHDKLTAAIAVVGDEVESRQHPRKVPPRTDRPSST